MFQRRNSTLRASLPHRPAAPLFGRSLWRTILLTLALARLASAQIDTFGRPDGTLGYEVVLVGMFSDGARNLGIGESVVDNLPPGASLHGIRLNFVSSVADDGSFLMCSGKIE